MRMSTKGRYGLRLMVALADRYGTGPVDVRTISREQAISANYVHVLLGTLKTVGLVRSTRGRDGGYELARRPATITAFDVVSALEGQTAPAECVAEPGACPRAGTCPTRDVWCQLAASIDGVMKSLTLQRLADDRRAQDEALSYSI